ncbi:MAG TPA: hypothetical protein VFO90_09750, partial [Terrimicrobiaceae bacterium]|nr:hypothetical protein [Terrimicrobiaceae bacterium]
MLQRRSVRGACASSRVVFGAWPNKAFRRDAGKSHAGTRALPGSQAKRSLNQGVVQDLGRMQRDATGAIFDLMPAACS